MLIRNIKKQNPVQGIEKEKTQPKTILSTLKF